MKKLAFFLIYLYYVWCVTTCGKLFSCCLFLLGAGYGGVLEEDQGVPYGQSSSFDAEQQRFMNRGQTERNTSLNVLTYVPLQREKNPSQNLIQVSQTEALILSKMEQLMTQAILSLCPERADEVRDLPILNTSGSFAIPTMQKFFFQKKLLIFLIKPLKNFTRIYISFCFQISKKKHDQAGPTHENFLRK